MGSLPKLQSTQVASPYVHEQNGIARVDSARLIDAKQRKLADDIFVPEPVMKKDKGKVRRTLVQ